MSNCKGCGIKLQFSDRSKAGFSPKKDVELCQRCFRMNNYDELVQDFQEDFDNYDILSEINKMDALIIWVVDLFDFESNLIAGLNRHLFDKDIIMVGTKRDLLPDSLGNDKLFQFLIRRLKEYGISVSEMLLTSAKEEYGLEELSYVIDVYRQGRDVVFIGQANAGKSSLINKCLGTELTISRYPGTTLDFSMRKKDDYFFIDTPGLINKSAFQYYCKSEDLKQLVPSSIKPKSFASSTSNAFIIEQLVKVEVQAEGKYTLVFYINEGLKIHRTNINKGRELWNQKRDLISTGNNNKKHDIKGHKNRFDIVLPGLGFISVIGEITNMSVVCDENIDVVIREALL